MFVCFQCFFGFFFFLSFPFWFTLHYEYAKYASKSQNYTKQKSVIASWCLPPPPHLNQFHCLPSVKISKQHISCKSLHISSYRPYFHLFFNSCIAFHGVYISLLIQPISYAWTSWWFQYFAIINDAGTGNSCMRTLLLLET